MRRIQQTSGKAFIRSRKVLDCPWKLTHHSINQCTGRQLSSGKNKISKADHFVDIGLEKALINAFITSADKHNRFFGCSDFTYTRIRQARPIRGKTQNWAAVAGGSDSINGLSQRLCHHDHAGTAAKRTVVNRTVKVRGGISRIPAVH